MAAPAPPNSKRPPWFLAGDQWAAGSLVALGLVALGVHWIATHWDQRRIEIETAAPLRAQFQVDINRADVPELLMLPEVGESLAQRIVAERQANGPFRDHNDLRRVRGIGPKTLERIQPYLIPLAETETWAGP